MKVVADKWTLQRRRQLTRDSLLESARRLFAARGFHGASLDEIAAEAGFSRGAIYSSFGGKEELFFAVIERHYAELMQRWRTVLSSGGPDLALSRLAEAWQDSLAADRDWFALYLEFRLYALRNPEVRERLAELERRQTEEVGRLISETATSLGMRLRVPAEVMATIAGAACIGLLERAIVDPTVENVSSFFFEMLAREFV
jgi:AcrR family transcriptional regulator